MRKRSIAMKPSLTTNNNNASTTIERARKVLLKSKREFAAWWGSKSPKQLLTLYFLVLVLGFVTLWFSTTLGGGTPSPHEHNIPSGGNNNRVPLWRSMQITQGLDGNNNNNNNNNGDEYMLMACQCDKDQKCTPGKGLTPESTDLFICLDASKNNRKIKSLDIESVSLSQGRHIHVSGIMEHDSDDEESMVQVLDRDKKNKVHIRFQLKQVPIQYEKQPGHNPLEAKVVVEGVAVLGIVNDKNKKNTRGGASDDILEERVAFGVDIHLKPTTTED